MPRVTVAIATYNCARYLPATIDSIRAQTFRDFEIVVADDCSTDDTREVLKSCGDSLKLISLPVNSGSPVAWNAAVRSSSSKYVVIAAADDIWTPDRLALQVGYLDAHPDCGLVYCRMGKIDEFGEQIGKERPHRHPEGWVFRELYLRLNFIGATAIVTRAAIESVGLFDPALRSCQDWDLYLRIAHDFKVGFVDKPLVLYRRHPSQVSQKRAPTFHFQRMVIEKIAKLYPDGDKCVTRKMCNEALGRQLMKEGRHWLEEGQKAKALKSFKEALKLNPTNLRAGRYLLKTLFAKH
jgi:glycosyltransferase involved in cell wall biosynthesis